MSSSLEVRQFLMQQDLGGPAVPAQRNGDSQGRVNDDQIRRARLAVASSAHGVDDCRQLLDMLGLVGDDDDGVPPVAR
jgi:hypothetical protein